MKKSFLILPAMIALFAFAENKENDRINKVSSNEYLLAQQDPPKSFSQADLSTYATHYTTAEGFITKDKKRENGPDLALKEIPGIEGFNDYESINIEVPTSTPTPPSTF